VQQITRVTLDAIARETSFTPQTSRAWLGPTIRVCCFEVGEEVVDQFRASYANADAFIDRTRGAKPHIDVAGLTRALLEERGIDVVDVGACTRCDARWSGDRVIEWSDAAEAERPPDHPTTRPPLFHSFRREPKRGGRNLAIVAR
jgi:copper oxidase (laccase) domain-containing protein